MAIKIASIGITTAGTVTDPGVTPALLKGLSRLSGMTLTCRFTTTGGSSTPTAKLYVQTTPDGGATRLDIKQFAFAAASANKSANLDFTAQVASVTPTDGTMGDDEIQHGIFLGELAIKLVTTGTYNANTLLELWMEPRA